MTSIHIEITTSEPVRTPTRRHVQIPPTDKVTQSWFDIQKDQSASVRMLIGDEVLQHGMVDRVTRQKFGTSVAQAAARAMQTPATHVAAAGPAPQAGSAFLMTPAAANTPTPWSVPLLDPRDAEIEGLKSLLAQRDAELKIVRDVIGPFHSFVEELQRQGLPTDTLV